MIEPFELKQLKKHFHLQKKKESRTKSNRKSLQKSTKSPKNFQKNIENPIIIIKSTKNKKTKKKLSNFLDESMLL